MFIDLRMPDTCRACGFNCCRPTGLQYKCGRDIWSSDYCNGDCVNTARSYPLDYNSLENKFEIINCFGFKKGLMPFKLIEVVKLLNELMPFIDSFHYQGKGLELTVSCEEPMKSLKVRHPINGLLELLDWEPKDRLAQKLY